MSDKHVGSPADVDRSWRPYPSPKRRWPPHLDFLCFWSAPPGDYRLSFAPTKTSAHGFLGAASSLLLVEFIHWSSPGRRRYSPRGLTEPLPCLPSPFDSHVMLHTCQCPLCVSVSTHDAALPSINVSSPAPTCVARALSHSPGRGCRVSRFWTRFLTHFPSASQVPPRGRVQCNTAVLRSFGGVSP